MYENLPVPMDKEDIPRFLDQELRKIADEFRDSIPLNQESVVVPTINDDARRGYSKFSQWINTATNNIYMCADSTRGAAIWLQIG
jgi:hypothetical protein